MMSGDEEFDKIPSAAEAKVASDERAALICGDPRFRREKNPEGLERRSVLARGLVDQARRERREDAPVRSLQRR